MHTDISSVRRLVVHHAERILASQSVPHGKADETQPPVPQLDPDYVQLYSRFVPTLSAGEYTVTVSQKISVPGTSEEKKLSSKQKLSVTLPVRFTLPTGAVHSIYPRLGQTETTNVLPHIVLADYQLPWERATGSETSSERGVPWLALLVFEVEELRLPGHVLSGGKAIFHTENAVHQSPRSWSIRMKLGDLFKTDATTSPIKKDDSSEPIDENTIADMIFITNDLFTSIFISRDSYGKSMTEKSKPDVDGFRFLTHVKNINTQGMADAGVETDQGLYSVVISARTGPVNITRPVRMVAHLVSIEGLEKMEFPPDKNKYDYVALCSLYSWNYECQPPSSPVNVDVIDCLTEIGSGISPLRAPDVAIQQALQSTDSVTKRVGERLSSGYTLVKYRVQSGDETVALTRGPCIPVPNDGGVYKNLDTMVHFPTSLQILDQEVGIMDVSYSSAWQLGKSLALADQSFATALGRLRTTTYYDTIKGAKLELASSHRRTRAHLLKKLSPTIAILQNFHLGDDLHDSIPPERLRRRWQIKTDDMEPSNNLPQLGMNHLRSHLDILEKHADSIIAKCAATVDSGKPAVTDWEVVLHWVLDKMFLGGIPSQYLISDPSFLPHESLRFFHIDSVWMDAFIDGALSLANHLEPEDFVRKAIKQNINRYLHEVDPSLKYKPQVPQYGFFLRSTLLSAFPDLVVRAPLPQNDPRCPIIRQTLLDTDILLCLFDRTPSAVEFPNLTFTRPAHQQGFFAADSITDDQFHVLYRKIQAGSTSDNTADPPSPDTWKKGDSSMNNVPYDWESRCILMNNYAQAVFKKLSSQSYFNDTAPTPEMMGIQLGGDVFDLTIQYKDNNDNSTQSQSSKFHEKWQPYPYPTRTLQFLEYQKGNEPRTIESQKSDFFKQEALEIDTYAEKKSQAGAESSDNGGRNHGSFTRPRLHQMNPDYDGNDDYTTMVGMPVFELAIFPTSSFYPDSSGSEGSCVPAASRFANDLVFALKIRSEAFESSLDIKLWIRSLVIKIPYGNKNRCLIQWPQRTVGSMISNRAFHLKFDRTKDQQTEMDIMQVEIVPKFGEPEISGWKDKDIGLSWVLSGVYTSEGSTVATIEWEENYRMQDPRYDATSLHTWSSFDVRII